MGILTSGHPFMEVMKDKIFVKKDGTKHTGNEVIKDKEMLVVYVSGTHLKVKRNVENLVKFYPIGKENKIEVIYLSTDSNQKEFEKHFKESHGDYYAMGPVDPAIESLLKAIDNPLPPQMFVFNKLGFLVKKSCTVKKLLEGKPVFDKWQSKTTNVKDRLKTDKNEKSASKESKADSKDESKED